MRTTPQLGGRSSRAVGFLGGDLGRDLHTVDVGEERALESKIFQKETSTVPRRLGNPGAVSQTPRAWRGGGAHRAREKKRKRPDSAVEVRHMQHVPNTCNVTHSLTRPPPHPLAHSLTSLAHSLYTPRGARDHILPIRANNRMCSTTHAHIALGAGCICRTSRAYGVCSAGSTVC